MRNPPQKKVKSKPPSQKQQSPGIFSSLFGGVLHGFSFGAGSSIAHEMFRENQTIPQESTTKTNCKIFQSEYERFCSNYELRDEEKCQKLVEDLKMLCPP